MEQYDNNEKVERNLEVVFSFCIEERHDAYDGWMMYKSTELI